MAIGLQLFGSSVCPPFMQEYHIYFIPTFTSESHLEFSPESTSEVTPEPISEPEPKQPTPVPKLPESWTEPEPYPADTPVRPMLKRKQTIFEQVLDEEVSEKPFMAPQFDDQLGQVLAE